MKEVVERRIRNLEQQIKQGNEAEKIEFEFRLKEAQIILEMLKDYLINKKNKEAYLYDY